MVVVSNLPPPDHGIRHEQAGTSAVINNKVLGKGTLYIAESHLSWVNGASGEGFSLEYAHISIHAVSRDRQSYPEECLYLLLDEKIDIGGGEEPQQPQENNRGESSNDADESEAGNDENDMTELRFIPEDKSSLDAMFTAMNDCQALHPDSQDSFSEDEAENAEDDLEDEGVEDDDGLEDYDSNLRRNRNCAANGDNDMDIDEGQFEDATD